jgi:hypothetical protein
VQIFPMLWAATTVEQQLNNLVGQLDAYVTALSAVQGTRHAEILYCRMVADNWYLPRPLLPCRYEYPSSVVEC